MGDSAPTGWCVFFAGRLTRRCPCFHMSRKLLVDNGLAEASELKAIEKVGG